MSLLYAIAMQSFADMALALLLEKYLLLFITIPASRKLTY